MSVDFNFMAGGEAGQGIQSMGLVLAEAIAYGGFHVFADQDYESRVRGGHNFFRIRVSEHEVLAVSEKLDILIALNRETIELHKNEVKNEGVIIFDQDQTKIDDPDINALPIPLSGIASETAKNKLMTNTVAVGAAIGLTGYSFDPLAAVLRKEFAKGGEKIVDDNIIAARAGFDFTLKHRKGKFDQQLKPVASATKRMLLHGNEALSLGALAGGCKFISGYPMTPSSPILEYLATKGPQFNVVAMHVEDEISAINMAAGAAFAGVRAMIATSGGGFSLMVEGLALAGMTETPLVMVLGQRPGPATGLPTRTEQGELWFALQAGHGEFPRAVLAPSTVEEAFHITIKAFNLAERYQTPVIILTDHHLASSYKTTERFDLKQVKIDRGELLTTEEANQITDYKRHQLAESGISPRAFPGQGKALVVTDSDEHDEAGHMIEDGETRKQQHRKRLLKANGLAAEIAPPRFHKVANAEFTLIGWGSTYGAIREAADLLKKGGVNTNILHLSEIWPFPSGLVSEVISKSAKSIVIEGNATAQMARLIRRETGKEISGSILRFDGRPITPQFIIAKLEKEVA